MDNQPQGPAAAPQEQHQFNNFFNQFLTAMQAFMLEHSVTVTAPAPPPLSAAPADALPRGVKAPTPDTYDGRDTTKVRAWLQRTRNVLSMAGFDLDTTQAVSYAASFLTGLALRWFESEGEHLALDIRPFAGFCTFDAFADAMLKQFGDPHPEDKARRDIANLKQTTSVRVYADKFYRLASLIPDRSPKDLRYGFIAGLKPKLRMLLVGKTEGMSWHDVRDLALRFDDAVMQDTHISRSFYNHQPRGNSSNYDPRPDDPMDISAVSTSYSRSRSSAPPSRRSSFSSASSRHPSPGPSHRRSQSPHPSKSSTLASSTSPRLAKLTPDERDYLLRNNGCVRCRKINAGHEPRSCPVFNNQGRSSTPKN